MARSKQPRHLKSGRSESAALITSPGSLQIKDYVFLNLIFAVFCIVQLLILRVLISDFAGLYFFFGFIMCAFFITSVFDCMAEKMDIGAHIEENNAMNP